MRHKQRCQRNNNIDTRVPACPANAAKPKPAAARTARRTLHGARYPEHATRSKNILRAPLGTVGIVWCKALPAAASTGNAAPRRSARRTPDIAQHDEHRSAPPAAARIARHATVTRAASGSNSARAVRHRPPRTASATAQSALPGTASHLPAPIAQPKAHCFRRSSSPKAAKSCSSASCFVLS